MTQPLIEGRNFNSDLYNRALSSAYRVWSRLYDPDYALSRDAEIWEKCRRDATIAQAIDTRLHMVAGRGWHLEPGSDEEASKEAASICEEILRNVKGFTEARLQLSTATFRARSYAFIEGSSQVRKYGDGAPRDWWVPIRLRDVDRRRVRYVAENYLDDEGRDRIRVKQQLWSVLRETFEDLDEKSLRQFVKIIYRNEESRLGYGRGLLDSIYFCWWMKSVVWKEGLQGLERWSQGVLIGKVASDREGSTGKTNEAIRDELFTALRDMRSRNVIVMGQEDDIEVRDGGGAGHEMVMSFIKYIDEKLLSLILGSVLPFGGGSESGSYARAQIEAETSNALIQFDREMLDEAITEDLITHIWNSNYRNFQALGLGSAGSPIFRTDLATREDPTQAAGIIQVLSSLGLPLKLAEVYRKSGFSVPAADDETFIATPAAPPAAPGGGLPFRDASEWTKEYSARVRKAKEESDESAWDREDDTVKASLRGG